MATLDPFTPGAAAAAAARTYNASLTNGSWPPDLDQLYNILRADIDVPLVVFLSLIMVRRMCVKGVRFELQ